MKSLYSIDIQLVATAYISAESEDEARKIVAEQLTQSGGELPVSDRSATMEDITVSGKDYADPELYDYGWSFSPAITIIGPSVDDDVEHVADLDTPEEDSEK